MLHVPNTKNIKGKNTYNGLGGVTEITSLSFCKNSLKTKYIQMQHNRLQGEHKGEINEANNLMPEEKTYPITQKTEQRAQNT